MTVLVMLVAVPAAQAVDIPVNTTADEYGNPPASCSLREAITSAQTNAAFGGCSAGLGSDTIKLPAGTYKITRAGAVEELNVTGDFDVTGTDSLAIRPATNTDKVIVDGNALDRVFDQQGSNSLAITGLDVIGGKTIGIGEDGGGIRNSSGTMSIEATTVSGSSTNYSGGGIAVYNSLGMINSTVSGNSAIQNGGGLYMPGGSLTTVKSSTITGNTADSDTDDTGDGGGFYDNASNGVNFFNVLDAANSDSSPTPANQTPDCYSNSTKFFPRFVLSKQPLGAGGCLVGFNPGTNLVAADAKIGPLAGNGGPTPTHALLVGSPAIGAGGSAPPDQCPATDQNGNGRSAGACDIGAVQYVAPVVLPPPPPPPTTPGMAKLKIRKVLPKRKKLRRGRKLKIKLVVRNEGTVAASNVKVCLKLKNRKSRKALKTKGKPCRKFASVAAGAVVRPKIKLTNRNQASLGKYRVLAVTKGSLLNLSKRSFKVKLR